MRESAHESDMSHCIHALGVVVLHVPSIAALLIYAHLCHLVPLLLHTMEFSDHASVPSASHAWGAIKNKLASQAGKAGVGKSYVTGDTEGAITPKTIPRKSGKKAADEDDAEETPPRSPRAGRSRPLLRKLILWRLRYTSRS